MDESAEVTLHVLREIWAADGQTDIDCAEGKSCKRMTDVGFEGFAEEYDGDLRAAWRATLKREGKLGSSSLADLLNEQPG